MTRVYVPTTLVGLAHAQKLGTLDDPATAAHLARMPSPVRYVSGTSRATSKNWSTRR